MAKVGAPRQHLQNTDRLDEIANRWRHGIRRVRRLRTLLERIQATLAALDANANPRLALECMMMEVPAV